MSGFGKIESMVHGIDQGLTVSYVLFQVIKIVRLIPAELSDGVPEDMGNGGILVVQFRKILGLKKSGNANEDTAFLLLGMFQDCHSQSALCLEASDKLG